MADTVSSTGFGTGGMITKIAAAEIATKAGCHMVILNGTETNPISRYLETGRGTWFTASETPLTAKKKWILGTLKTAGSIHIDAGAFQALENGKSLLPAGVVETSGEFGRGDAVDVIFDNNTIAQGLISYSRQDTRQLMGQKTSEIIKILKFDGPDEIIHRNDLVMK
jgi:glutamate 5-kinase